MEAQVPKLSLTISLYQRSWGNSVNEYVDCRVVLGGEPKEFFFIRLIAVTAKSFIKFLLGYGD